MTEIVLSLTLIATNALWAFVCFRLSDRLMSRDYVSFVQAERLKKPVEKASVTPDDAVIDPEDERKAQELNRIFNIV